MARAGVTAISVEDGEIVLIGEHAESVRIGGREPLDEFGVVFLFGFVGVIAVEQRDSLEVVGNLFEAVEIGERKGPACAMAREDEFRAGKSLAERVDDRDGTACGGGGSSSDASRQGSTVAANGLPSD